MYFYLCDVLSYFLHDGMKKLLQNTEKISIS